MPSIYEPEPLYIPVPDPEDRRNTNAGERVEDAPKAPAFYVTEIGGDEPVETKEMIAMRKRLDGLERGVRGLNAGVRVDGWSGLLRTEFAQVVGNLSSLPADEQGNTFHAAFDRPVIGGQETARLKFWYGRAAENPRPAVGQKIMTVQVNDRDRLVVDCLDTASSLMTTTPRLDYSASIADMVMGARDAIEGWADKASGNKRTREVRGAVKTGLTIH